MLSVDKNVFFFRTKIIYFAEYPHNVEGCHVLRFPFCKNKVEANGFTRIDFPTSVIDLTQDLDTIWRKLDKKSSRYAVNRAQRDRVEFKINADYEQFYKINASLEAQKSYGGIMASKLETMRKYGTLFTARYAGEVLGGHLYLEDEANMMLWLSASKRLEVDREKATLIGNANRLLHWEAIKYAKEKGIKEFDWGGLWTEEEASKDESKKAINSFKLSFGGEIVPRYSYRKVYSKVYRLAEYLAGLTNRGVTRW